MSNVDLSQIITAQDKALRAAQDLAQLPPTQRAGEETRWISASGAGFQGAVSTISAHRGGSGEYDFLTAYSGDFSDLEIRMSGDGNGYCAGNWTGGGADYAEFFEWADGNPDAQDRRGLSVVLEGNRIRVAGPGEDPVGVISGNPSVVGDGDMARWKGKYLRDAFGSELREDHEVIEWRDTSIGRDGTGRNGTGGARYSFAVDAIPEGVIPPEDAVRRSQSRRMLNPDYDPQRTYVPRAERAEWDMVGLMGKLRLRKGQITGARWVKMRDLDDTLEEWLVR